METVYLDNSSTTKIDDLVIETMKPFLSEKYGNASSIHALGIEAKKALEDSRKIIADSINADLGEIIFTSSGTESNNLALKGIAFANREKGNHLITTKIEHKSVLETCKWLETQGFEITYLNVDSEGFINLEELEKSITPQTILVSVIHGNNEIGTIQDIEAIGQICKEKDIYFHTDACQSFTKTLIDAEKQNISLMSLNSHKIHGPKGVGALYVKKGVKIDSLLHGGGQESGIRSGTEDIHGIVGFAEAVKLVDKKYVDLMIDLRDKLIEGILKIPDSRLNGAAGRERLCNNVNVSFRKVEGEAICGLLDEERVCASTGSACAEKTLDPSHVLSALGLIHEDLNGSLRLTLSKFTTEEEIDYVVRILPGIINKLRELSPL
ncbi:cysteine desulfurase NifS [Candidatus Pacearchaeota archaeon]|nr:cysteine desulfurase NifS [Candidatus Pacearchaeota archaeon]|tara:strand:+ start:3050 stop:4192 length:1143 start_codon:yes stop_codon:yes gene_type:complete